MNTVCKSSISIRRSKRTRKPKPWCGGPILPWKKIVSLLSRLSKFQATRKLQEAPRDQLPTTAALGFVESNLSNRSRSKDSRNTPGSCSGMTSTWADRLWLESMDNFHSPQHCVIPQAVGWLILRNTESPQCPMRLSKFSSKNCIASKPRELNKNLHRCNIVQRWFILLHNLVSNNPELHEIHPRLKILSAAGCLRLLIQAGRFTRKENLDCKLNVILPASKLQALGGWLRGWSHARPHRQCSKWSLVSPAHHWAPAASWSAASPVHYRSRA